ncbi:MAG TPA: TetR/AcrR family transcriptional regulator [Actinomycetota bacterium]|nr:TetR/AcrR family transcriptional regulator [Actinomycetota bacterium]
MGERGQARRERVLDAALEVIAERGLAETRMSDISARAGMSPGHVLYYFRTKDLVLMEALRHVETQMHEGATAELRAIPPGPERLRRLLELNIPDGIADPGWTLWLEAWTLAPHDDAIRALVAELERRWLDLLREVVRSGIDAGTFSCEDVDGAVTRLYATINGVSVQVVTGAGALSSEAAIEACMAVASSELGIRPGRAGRGRRPRADADGRVTPGHDTGAGRPNAAT